jgi:hypothetical protein
VRIEAIAVHLRPRSMSEATDLGVRLVQANARSVWATFTPVWAVVALIALACASIAPWLPVAIVFCLKPWLDRTLLFVLSRAVFGTPTRLRDVWAAQTSVWWQQLFSTLTWRRLSPWRSYTQPARQLEGQRGAAGRARRKQLLHGKQGAAFGMHSAFAQLESLLLIGVMVLAVWFVPEGPQRTMFESLFSRSDNLVLSLLTAAAYAAVVLLVEPFYVGAGFAMYLNRRVELEAWDIEQEFRLAFSA